MKALVKRNAEKGIWMEDVPEPDVGMNDVLIRILRTAICGTDLHIYEWNDWAAKTIPVPMVVGHEFVGEIVEVGTHVVCGRCRNCMAGRRHYCAHTSGVGVNRPGAFAEYISLPMSNVWEHRPGIDLDIASIFDPFGNAVHTALQFDLLGEDVLITGAGPIGCMAAAVCRHAGARNVVITDLSDYRLGLASALGATRTVNIKRESLTDIEKELHMREGFDIALEMSGAPSAFQDILDNLCHGGRIAVLGIPDENYAIDWEKVIFNMITIRGVYGREMYETWYKMSVFIESGLDLMPIITHRLPIDEFQQGFDAMESGQAGKVVLDWTV
jgi:threonine 3-dehydrogenase